MPYKGLFKHFYAFLRAFLTLFTSLLHDLSYNPSKRFYIGFFE
ncbi:hypothetical protein [Enterococcus phage vB_Efs19_KEN17]